jgi:hypothetical protein
MFDFTFKIHIDPKTSDLSPIIGKHRRMSNLLHSVSSDNRRSHVMRPLDLVVGVSM